MSKRIPILMGLLLIFFIVWVQISSIPFIKHWLIFAENAAYDFQMRAKIAAHFKPLTTSVVVVDIDDKSLQAIGRWPWPRSKLAELSDRISVGGAAVIAYDIIFPEKEENIANIVLNKITEMKLTPAVKVDALLKKLEPYFDSDLKLAKSLKQIDSILAITFVPQKYSEGMIPAPALRLTTEAEKQLGFYTLDGVLGNITVLQQAAKNAGFINVFADNDGIIRRVPLLIRYQNGLYPSLALEAASLYLLSPIQLQVETYGQEPRLEGVKMGTVTIPTDAKGQVIIPYRGKSYTFPFFSAIDVLNQKIPQDAFSGKIVFIGTSATGLADLKATSIQNVFPGVEIQATIADGILKNDFSRKPDWALGAQISLTILFGIMFAFAFPYCGPRTLGLLVIALPTTLIFSNAWLWDKTGLIIVIIGPVLLAILIGMLNMVYGYLFETRRREHLKEMFGQYVPEKHIDEMLKSKGEYGLYGEDRIMTVLFADIRDFTTISEKLTATQLKELLNEVFTPMTEIIFNHRGTIDKYIGDLIMAFWGAPLSDTQHAQNALGAALDMQSKLKELRATSTNKNLPEVHMGVGLNSGLMSVGDMGSKYRRNYTVLGDSVNVASRVEGLTKHYGADIIVTENTQKNQKNFIFRELDRVRVKGKKECVEIYELVCQSNQLTPQLKNEITLHDVALNLYYQQQWDNAAKAFNQLNVLYPQKKLYSLYLKRIAEFKLNPPPRDWDGAFSHLTK